MAPAKKGAKKAAPKAKRNTKPQRMPKRTAEKKWLTCADCGLLDSNVKRGADDEPRCTNCAAERAEVEITQKMRAKIEAQEATQRVADEFGADVRITAHDANGETPGAIEAKPRPKQRKLDADRVVGDAIDLDDVEVEVISKQGAKLRSGMFQLSITDDQAEEIRELDPVTRDLEVAGKMRVYKDGTGRVPKGVDWDRSLDKLRDRIVEGGW